MDYIIPVCFGATLPWMSQFLCSKICQFNELRKMVSSEEENPSIDCSSVKGFINSTYKSILILKTSFEVMISQKMYSPSKLELPWSCSKNSKFVYIFHNMKWYKVPFILKKGPLQREITSITDEAGVDITKYILPFTGPQNDFFDTGITPQFFGLDIITIVSDGEKYIFHKDIPIVFSPENQVLNQSDEQFILPTESIITNESFPPPPPTSPNNHPHDVQHTTSGEGLLL